MNGNSYHSSTLTNGIATRRPLHNDFLPNGHAPTPIPVSVNTHAHLPGGHNLAPLPPSTNSHNNSYSAASFVADPQLEMQRNGIPHSRPTQTQPVQNTDAPSFTPRPVLQRSQEQIIRNDLYDERQFSAHPLSQNNLPPQEQEMDQALEKEEEFGDVVWVREQLSGQQFEPLSNAAPAAEAASAHQSITNQLPATHVQHTGRAFPYSNSTIDTNHTTNVNHNRDRIKEPSSLSQPLIMSAPTPGATTDFLNNYSTHMNSRLGQQLHHQQGRTGQAEEQTQGGAEQWPEEQQPTVVHTASNPMPPPVAPDPTHTFLGRLTRRWGPY